VGKVVIHALLALLCCSSFAAAATPQTYIYLNSQPGDYIGGGLHQTFTSSDGSFSVTPYAGSVTVSFNTPDYSHWWYLDFGAPTTAKFVKSQYDQAQRFAFHSPTKPGLDVFGDGRGCNTLTGRFLVSEYVLAIDGSVARLAIDFEQHCEDGSAALYGSVRYNSTVTRVARVSVADSTVLKGNVGISDGLVPLVLSMPTSQVVTVQYVTSGGGAVAGTDYVLSSGQVTFAPGTTSSYIAVPILGNRTARGNKTFQVKLSSPTAAPLGDSTANVKILDPSVSLTVLAMSSKPGDYIGQGHLHLFTAADGSFSTTPLTSGVAMALNAGDSWNADFVAADNAAFKTGAYAGAQRYPFQAPGHPGLSVYGAGRGCNTLTGNFSIGKLVYNSTGGIQRFAADFEQHCEGLTPALFGWLRVNSTLRQFSIANADVGPVSANFTITLNPASATSASVTFATVDDTAVAGVDYAATEQTITFSPGETTHIISVPLLATGTGKRFFGQLSSPSGAAVWLGKASGAF
jgi:hypothetical protein